MATATNKATKLNGKSATSKPRTTARTTSSPKPSSKAKGSLPSTPMSSVPPPTKRQQLADLLTRDAGATLDQMVSATGWLPHTVRAALTGLRKAGYRIDSDRVEGLRTWRAVAP